MSGPVLVTGATGKTGAELVKVLQRERVPFSGAVRRIEPERGYPQVLFDWADPHTWAAALMGVESLYLVKPHHDVVDACAELLATAPFLRRVVLLSELGRESKSASDPERGVERAVEEGPAPWTILRPSWFFQNFSDVGGYGEPIRTEGELRLPIGGARLSLIDTRDVAAAAFVALTTDDHLGAGLDVTGPEACSMTEVADRIAAAAGRPVAHRSVPLDDYREGLVAGGSDAYVVDYLMDLLVDTVAGDFARVTDDLERVTGHPPRTLDAFVSENVDYWAAGRA